MDHWSTCKIKMETKDKLRLLAIINGGSTLEKTLDDLICKAYIINTDKINLLKQVFSTNTCSD